MKAQILAAAFLFGSSSFALAADPGLPMEEPIVYLPAGFNWTGAYIGGQVGYAWGDSYYSDEPFGDYADYDPDGFFGGLYAGYNHQFANGFVVGIDGDINVTDVAGTTDIYWNGNAPEPSASADVKYSGALRGRLGYAVDRFMPYIAGGLSFAKYEFDFRGIDGDLIFEESKTLTGWNIGAGVEYAATDNILIRAEYRYSDFGSKNFSQSWDDPPLSASIDLKTHDIRLGVAYKF